MRRLIWIGVLALALAAAWLAYALYAPYQGFTADGVYVEVPHGASKRTIARVLAKKGVIRSRLAFEALCRWHPRRTLQAGEYFFDRPVKTVDVFRVLAEGRVYVKTITVPEGLTMIDIAELLDRESLLNREAFLMAARDPSPVRGWVPDARTLEGFLFPATYQFPRHVTPQEVIAAMVQRFQNAWQTLPEAARNQGGRRLHEVVTLASLIERETPLAAERPIVAGVFTNRLRSGIPLQCDPTVIYALELAGDYSGRLDSGDLQFESPYNTYRHTGLPPGPIANPGEASLRAALEPAAVDYLYFVSNTRGGHFFSRTLKEHNHNVALYRRLLAQNQRTAAQGDLLDGSEDGLPPATAEAEARKRWNAARPR